MGSFGPDGMCHSNECREISFGALKPLPTGYSVWLHAEHEHYQAHGPNEWSSAITVSRWQARRWALAKAGVK